MGVSEVTWWPPPHPTYTLSYDSHSDLANTASTTYTTDYSYLKYPEWGCTMNVVGGEKTYSDWYKEMESIFSDLSVKHYDECDSDIDISGLL